MGLFSSKPRYSRVLRIEAPDAASMDGCIAHLKDKAPDVLGYTGTKMRIIKTGPTEGLVIVDGRDSAQMVTHVEMTSQLRDETISKFNLTVTTSQGEIVWAS